MIERVPQPAGELDDDQLPAVPFVPFRCPACNRHKPFTYGRVGKTRYHQCQSCGQKYRSFEKPATDVSGWADMPP
jgi:transcription elongation factor Elf1